MTEAPARFKLGKQGNYHSSRRMIGIRAVYQLLCSIVTKYLTRTKERLSIQLKVSAGWELLGPMCPSKKPWKGHGWEVCFSLLVRIFIQGKIEAPETCLLMPWNPIPPRRFNYHHFPLLNNEIISQIHQRGNHFEFWWSNCLEMPS